MSFTGAFPGTIKNLDYQGAGTVTTDEGLDLAINQASCTDGKTFQVGDRVMFDLVENTASPGQFMAGNVSGGSLGGKGCAGNGAAGQWGAAKGGWGAAGGGVGQAAAGGLGPLGANTGTVAKFVPEKGFGFVQGADGTPYFFHRHQIVDGKSPVPGDVLCFDLEPSPIKPGQMQGCNISGGSGDPLAVKGSKGGHDQGKGGKGCGFAPGMATVSGEPTGEIRYDDPSHAQMAVAMLNNSAFRGATITVRLDMNSKDGTKLIVEGLPAGSEWHELKDHFSPMGMVAYAGINGVAKGKGKGGDSWDAPAWKKQKVSTGDPVKDALVEKIKQFQRSGEVQKQAWWTFCDASDTKNHDPARYDNEVLQAFVQGYGI